MSEQTETPQADATLDLWMDAGQLRINVAGPDDHAKNEAVHFAHWVGRHLPALVMLAREDYEAQRSAAKAERQIISDVTPKLRGPDGKPVN